VQLPLPGTDRPARPAPSPEHRRAIEAALYGLGQLFGVLRTEDPTVLRVRGKHADYAVRIDEEPPFLTGGGPARGLTGGGPARGLTGGGPARGAS